LDLQSFFLSFSSIIGILAFFIVLANMRRELSEKYFFLLFIFSLSYYCFVVLLIYTNEIIEYPHFFRTASPFLYALPIAFYLYYKNHVTKVFRKNRIENLLLLIPIIHFFELLPFYLQSASVKRQYLLSLVNNEDDMIYSFEGWISTFWHGIFQVSLAIILFVLVLADQKTNRSNQIKKPDKISLWFKWASFFQLICFLILLVILIIDSENIDVYRFITLVFSSIQLMIVVNIFLQPELLYGSIRTLKLEKKDSKIFFSEDDIRAGQEKIENYFERETKYLKSEFRQQDLAKSINMSRNNLSYIVNEVYQMNFNQLLNKKRIEVVIKKLNAKDDWDKLSLSGVSQEVGFKSRTTFIKAFKSNMGMTPSKYINSLS